LNEVHVVLELIVHVSGELERAVIVTDLAQETFTQLVGVADLAEELGERSGHRIGSGVAGGNAVEDVPASTRLAEREGVICEVLLLGFLILQAVGPLQLDVLEFSDEIGFGADVSGVTARDRIGGIESLKRKIIDFLPVSIARNLAGHVLGPGEDLVAKGCGGLRLDLDTVNVEAEPEDFSECVFDGVIEMQATPVVTLI